MSTSALVLGVDGGGSKTEVLLAELTQSSDPEKQVNILARALSGSSNLRSAGKQQGLANLDQVISEALTSANVTADKLDSVVLGLAGSAYPDVQDDIADWCAAKGIGGVYQLISDVVPVLYAGNASGRGIALIAGTGSIAMGRDAQGRSLSRGGWGHWFGDKGSGFDLGRRALNAVAEAVDGIGPDTQLVERVQQHMQVSEPREILLKMARPDESGQVSEKFQIAKLAPVVLAAAEAGDMLAKEIVNAGASDLCRLIASIVSTLFVAENYPLALAGGLLSGNQYYRDTLIRELKGQASTPASISIPASISVVSHPVQGCLAIAREAVFSA